MMLIINAIICSLIVLRLALFVRTGRHRIFISICAYLITVAAGIEVILTVYGVATVPSYAELFLKATLCIAIFQVRGNVAHLLQLNTNKASSRLVRIPRPQTFKTKHR
ncbi:phage holin family protein [Shewanella baltica]|uniref:phage holin family protein n=1 Tax=Shewanella baltica TaxID=62322 RepID=UPI00217D457D|nr:phage holin family protein [Shewanella baltica]MCS6133976.1 phage holin family protein [Shewanella baltica]